MRCALACQEAETIDTKDIYDILLFGTIGWKDNSDDDVLDAFIKLWGEKQIPYIKEEQ
jgi:hypothetical protein